MKERLYAGKINFKKKRWKNVDTHIFDKMGKLLFVNPNVYTRMGYLASIMF